MIDISIIIPTLNRATTLSRTLASILKQEDLNGIEVIVIDNGSSDNTNHVCNEFTSKNDLPFYYHRDPEPGLLTGRHLGASVAKGNILCFLDDDVELDKTWLTGVRDAFIDNEVQLATGPSIPNFESDPPIWLKYFWINTDGGKYCDWLSLMDFGNEKKVIHPFYVWGLNFCIRKSALLALEGFHPDNIAPAFQMFQGDGETGLALKAYYRKYKSLYHPKIKLFHIITSERLTVDYFKKRAFYQGVCNSFTQLREQYNHLAKRELRIVSLIKKFLRPIKKVVISFRKESVPVEIEELKKLLKQEERKGYNFHQEAYLNNEKVKEWVYKNNYWDYKLPR